MADSVCSSARRVAGKVWTRGIVPVIRRHEVIRRITHPDPRSACRGTQPLPKEISTLRRWIPQGASGRSLATSSPSACAPRVSDAKWGRNGIDRFVLARLDQEKLKPSGPASCDVLIRRVSLDLIGLPPTPEEAAAFCRDPSEKAYQQVVERLLASPRYGEHWAAMWLDLSRYADTRGYERDFHRAIWRYRDWLIDSFNRDLPFDRFTTEQMAGDLIPGATDEQVLGTAFHRNTMTNDEGGTSDEEFRNVAVLDRVNTTWEVWQGTTMSCVQCHSTVDQFSHRILTPRRFSTTPPTPTGTTEPEASDIRTEIGAPPRGSRLDYSGDRSDRVRCTRSWRTWRRRSTRAAGSRRRASPNRRRMGERTRRSTPTWSAAPTSGTRRWS